MHKQLLSLSAYILSTLNLQKIIHTLTEMQYRPIQRARGTTHVVLCIPRLIECMKKYCRVITAHGTECFHKLQSINPQKPNMPWIMWLLHTFAAVVCSSPCRAMWFHMVPLYLHGSGHVHTLAYAARSDTHMSARLYGTIWCRAVTIQTCLQTHTLLCAMCWLLKVRIISNLIVKLI